MAGLHPGSSRRVVGMGVRAAGGGVHGHSGRSHRHRCLVDDRPQVRHLSSSLLAEPGTVLLVRH